MWRRSDSTLKRARLQNKPVIVEWYRLDQSKRIRRVLVAGAAVLTTGGVVVGGAFLTHQGESLQRVAACAGVFLTVAGAAFTAFGMQRILAVDAYLALCKTGLLAKLGGEERYFAWEEIAGVAWDEGRRAIVLELKLELKEETFVFDAPLAGVEGRALAPRLDHARKKASLLGN
jgi:hypothetical protein